MWTAVGSGSSVAAGCGAVVLRASGCTARDNEKGESDVFWNPVPCVRRRPITARRFTRVAAAAVGALTLALAAATAASAGAGIKVSCAGQAALVAAVNAANASGGGTINLAAGCDYSLTSVDNNAENGLPVVTTPISVNGTGQRSTGRARYGCSRSTVLAGACRCRM